MTLHSSQRDAILSHVIYETTYFLAAAGMTLGWSLRTEGRQNIPASGPALLIANHQSFLDPLLIGLGTRRHLRYLARKTLFKHPLLAWLIRMLNAVPIDHEGVGKEGLRTILGQLDLGQAVVVFPEGERTSDGRMQALRPGIHLLIKRTQAPIIPIGVAGAYGAWPRWRAYPVPAPLFWPCPGSERWPGAIAVSIGRPLEARRFAELPRRQALQELFREIEKCWRRAQRLRSPHQALETAPVLQ
jgi:1-acyl-sn-glycerol-3-phosphate acyltransferase